MHDIPTFLPFHSIVTATSANPSRYMLVLHGIFGAGGNFRTFIRRLADTCPNWGFVLVDLRGHGQSLGAPPPHTVEASAQDLVHLGTHLGLEIRGIMGHSFGGKVALAHAGLRPDELGVVLFLQIRGVDAIANCFRVRVGPKHRRGLRWS